MRGMAVAAVTIGVLLAPMPALGQEPPYEFMASLSVTSQKGEKGKPRPALLAGRFGVDVRDGQTGESPTVMGWRLLLPKGFTFNGGRYPVCPKRRMPVGTWLDHCPKGAIVGGTSYFVESPYPGTRPSTVFLNGGAQRIWAYMTIYYPALVREPAAIDVRRLRSRKWAYELTFKLPKIFIIVAGVPVRVNPLDFRVGGRKPAIDYWTVDRECPARGFRGYRASVSYVRNDGSAGESRHRGRLPC
jgi:hypothetical protein